MNDIIETNYGEVYITQWLPKPVTKNGVLNTFNFNQLYNIYSLIISVINLPNIFKGYSNVIKCTFNENDLNTNNCNCEIAATNFYSANGITFNTITRDEIYVNDNLKKQVVIYKIDKNNKLQKINNYKLPLLADNVEFINNELHFGAINNPMEFFLKSFYSNIIVEGSLMIGKKNNKNNLYEFIVQEKPKSNGIDGLIYGISSAVSYNNFTIFGAPKSNGLLICKE